MKKLITFVFALLSSASLATAQDAVTVPNPSATPAASTGATQEVARVVVTGGEIERSSTDTAQAVTVLTEDQLKEQAAASLGDTLASQAGIAASGFSPGASRPIIRGWNRITSVSIRAIRL